MERQRVFLARLIFAIVLLGAPVLLADGPHWQVPNPDGPDEESPGDGEEKKKDEPKKKLTQKEEMEQRVRAMMSAAGHDSNPGNFLKMDEPCFAYYMVNMHIAMAKGNNDVASTYKQIVQRAAQAMREVDTYCPCPDSSPLWQSEEKRAKMVEYAKRTWVLSAQLKPELAAMCADVCVENYLDTVRFSDDAKAKRLEGLLKKALEQNKKIAELLLKIDGEKDERKRAELLMEWRRMQGGRDGLVAVSREYKTFALITGDIPILVDDALVRMVTALSDMGYPALSALQKHLNHPNKTVQTCVKNLSDIIISRMAQPTLPNIEQHLRTLERLPRTLAANVATRSLKEMGNLAIPLLIEIAEREKSPLKSAACSALETITFKGFRTDLAKWKEYWETVKAQPKPKPEPKAPDKPDEEQAEAVDTELKIVRKVEVPQEE
jgi:hypothetical protein